MKVVFVKMHVLSDYRSSCSISLTHCRLCQAIRTQKYTNKNPKEAGCRLKVFSDEVINYAHTVPQMQTLTSNTVFLYSTGYRTLNFLWPWPQGQIYWKSFSNCSEGWLMILPGINSLRNAWNTCWVDITFKLNGQSDINFRNVSGF